MATEILPSSDTTVIDAAADSLCSEDEIKRAIAVACALLEGHHSPSYLTIKTLPPRRDTFTTVDQIRRRIEEDAEDGRKIIDHLLRMGEMLMKRSK